MGIPSRVAALAALIVLLHASAHAQSVIGGVVNRYAPVTALTCNGVVVPDATGFAAGDTVLIIQMKGATIDTTDTPLFGTITDAGDAGNYEFGIIHHITGNAIFLRDVMLNHYAPSGLLQIIRVPHYDDVTIGSTLTAPAWDGATGGVVAIDAAGEITLNADVDLHGRGFRGGLIHSFDTAHIDRYAAPLALGYGGGKGEGICLEDPLRNACRGAQANGGGGGNAHNAGGGGGSNSGTGGTGGDTYINLGREPYGGIGGRSLLGMSGSSRIFVGGGGGAGHDNDGVGTAGANGGGIVILRAARLSGNGHFIDVGGDGAKESGQDGAGGGGAGGSVVVDIQTLGSPVTVDISGGKGGDCNNSDHETYCHGPGGGGSGGTFLCSLPSLPPAMTIRTTGGAAGTEVNRLSICFGSTYGASVGAEGSLLYGTHVSQGTSIYPLWLARADKDTMLCSGGIAHLRASGGSSYRWSPSTGLDCPTCANTDAHPTATTTYAVAITSGEGCIVTDSVHVTVVETGHITTGPDITLCAGDSARLSTSGATGVIWTPAAGLDCATCPAPMASPAGTTTYHVTMRNASGCTNVDSVVVTVTPRPSLQLTGTATICLGDSTRLQGIGNGPMLWSPAEGLSCTDCASPLASPTRTTTYHATVGSGSCVTTDSVTVSVVESTPITATIAPDARVRPGGSVRLPVLLNGPISTFNRIGTINLTIGWNPHLLVLGGADLDGTGLQGWTLTSQASQGQLIAMLKAPQGEYLKEGGAILYVTLKGYLSDITSSDLRLDAAVPGMYCASIASVPGAITVDSICGLSFRLIALTSDKYSLGTITPNPLSASTEIPFTLGLSGHTTLDIFDADGNRVARLVDQDLPSGGYRAVWEATRFASGLYYSRLRSGDWSATQQIVLAR